MCAGARGAWLAGPALALALAGALALALAGALALALAGALPASAAAVSARPGPVAGARAGKSAAAAPARPAVSSAKAPDKSPAARPAEAEEADPASETRHMVKPGETLGGVAARAEVPRVLIIEANGLRPPYGLRMGQVLVIPRRREHLVRPGETGFAIAMDHGVPWSAIAAANGLAPQARVRAGQKLVIPVMTKAPPPPVASAPAARPPARPTAREDEYEDGGAAGGPAARIIADSPVRFGWPAAGQVRRGFAPRSRGASSRESVPGKARPGPHDGIDIAGDEGDPVRAAARGLVWYAGKEPNLYGNVVILDHGQGWFSAYAKLSRVTVKKGETVSAGERVGLIGNTGSTPTTELHFEIRRQTVPVDPLRLLPRRP